MIGDFFGILDGISPLWWIGFGLLLGIIELAAMAFVLIWPGIAAFVVAAVLAIKPDMSGDAQIIWFTVLSLVFTVIGRYLVRNFGDGAAVSPGLNNRGHALIGRTAPVVDVVDKFEGVVQVGDTRWKAVWVKGTPTMGDRVRITDVDGMRLKVEAI